MQQFEDKSSKSRIFNGRYLIKRHISAGSFGVVFLCTDMQTKESVAMKVEKQDVSKHLSLEREVQMLEELKKVPGVPRLLWAGNEHDHNCMVLQLLGKDLSHYLKAYKKFSIKCVTNIAMQILVILEGVHRKYLIYPIRGIIHRDMKPENVICGKDDINLTYLADFGISKFYREPNGTHISFMEGKQFVGTTRYASLNAHRGYEISRRDDLESLGYMLVYLFKGFLPWQNVHNLVNEKEKTKLVFQIKNKTSIEELCSDMPQEFVLFFQYVRSLSFKASPDYRYMMSLFEGVASAGQFKNDKRLDWAEHNTLTVTKAETAISANAYTQLGRQVRLESSEKQTDVLNKSKRGRSRHQSQEQMGNIASQDSFGSSQNNLSLQQSSILINYQNSQFSNNNLKLGSSKLVNKRSERNIFKSSANSSKGSLVNVQSQQSLLSKRDLGQNSQFIALAQEDFQDLEEFEERMKKEEEIKKKVSQKDKLKQLKVREIHEFKDKDTNLSALNFEEDDGPSLATKVKAFEGIKFKQDLAKY